MLVHPRRARRTRSPARILPRILAALLGLALLPAGVAAAAPAPPAVPAVPSTLVLTGPGTVVVEGLPTGTRGAATVALLRGGAVVAVATGPVGAGVGDGAGLVAGAPGHCWADPAGRPVPTRPGPGDVVALELDGRPLGTTVVPDVGIEGPAEVRGSTVVVRGHAPPGLDPAALEHRVVDAGLAATDIGRGDVRAVVGPPVRGPGGAYVSQLTVAGTEVTATYLFDDPVTAARVAGAPGSRLTVWSDAPPGARRGAVVAGPPPPSPPPPGPSCPPGPVPRAPDAVPVPGAGGIVFRFPPEAAVYYTTDGADPRAGDLPAPAARRYTGLVVVPAPRTVLSWAVFDPATGLFGARHVATVDPPLR